MNFTRIKHTMALNLINSAPGRADYLRKNNVFGMIGEKVAYSPRVVPLYPQLIKIHNNVNMAAGIKFITHDVSDNMINNYLKENGIEDRLKEKIGCIEIMDNVFVGAYSKILYDVRIGENCIIGAGSLVVKDIPPNSIAAGVPCRVIGRFDEFVKKRLAEGDKMYENCPVPLRGMSIPEETAQYAWKEFEKNRR